MMSEKKLGFGLMRLPLKNPDDAASIDLKELKRMVDAFLDRGFTYFDTAWMYCAFQSENAVKEALVSRHPRDSFTLATKLLTIICSTMWDRITTKRTPSLTAFPGLWRRRNRAL